MYTASVYIIVLSESRESFVVVLCLLQYVKSREINPHAKEAWKVTKSGVKGKYHNTLSKV